MAVTASAGDRVFADGVKRRFPGGPAECDVVVDGGVLLVLPKSPSPASSEKGGEDARGVPSAAPPLATIALSAMFDRNDPLECVCLNRNSLVLHRRSDAGKDGLLLLFEREERLNEFLLALTPVSVVAPSPVAKPGALLTPSGKPRARDSGSRASKSPARVVDQQQSSTSITTPRRRMHTSPRPKALPSAVKTPTTSGQHTHADQSATSGRPRHTQSPSTNASRAARRQGTADDATPSVSFVMPSPSDTERGALYATPSPALPQQLAAPSVSPSQPYYLNRHLHHPPPATDVPPPSHPQQQQQYSSLYPPDESGGGGGIAARGSVSGGTARSISAGGFSKRSGSTAVDDYFRRTDRIETLMDTLEEASQERSSLLDDIFQQRDRRRLQTLLRLSLNDVMTDESKQPGHKGSVATRERHSQDVLSPRHVDPRGEEGVAAADEILDKIKSLLRSEAGAAHAPASRSVDDARSTSPVVAGTPPGADDFARRRGTSEDDGIGSTSLVARIKSLLSAGVGDFEALRDEVAEGGEDEEDGVAAGTAATAGFRGPALGPRQHPLPPAGRETVAAPPVPLSREMQLALEAEAKILNTIHYSALAVKKPNRVNPTLTSDAESDTATSSPVMKEPSRAPLALHGAPTSAGSRPMLDRNAVVGAPVDLTNLLTAPTPSNVAASASPASPKPPVQPVRVSSPSESPLGVGAPGSSTVVSATTARPAVAPASSTLRAADPRENVSAGADGESDSVRGAAVPSPASPWREVKDPSTGRSYFVNRDTKKTTWNRSDTDLPQNSSPLSAAAAGTPVSPSPSLAAAAVSEMTSLAPSPASPSSPSPVIAAATPGPGWFAKTDPSTKRVFYVHPATKKTTWNLAETLAVPTVAATAEAATTVAEATSVSQPTAVSTTSTPSPQGWLVKLDPKSGKAYYVNAALKKTTWKIEETDLPSQQQQQPQGSTSASPSSPATAAAGSSWRAAVDPKSGKTYYVHKDTKQVSWKVPTTDVKT